jgi:hypothetical protein
MIDIYCVAQGWGPSPTRSPGNDCHWQSLNSWTHFSD